MKQHLKNVYDLEQCTVQTLRTICSTCALSTSGTKRQLIERILKRYYQLKQYISYHYIKQLGREGKDGRAFLVQNDQGEEYAIKLFKSNKSEHHISREASLQTIAADARVAPPIIEYDTCAKYIVMKKLDYTLYDLYKRRRSISTSIQKQIVKLFDRLDACGVFHGDPNPLNFMYDKQKRRWYIIDYGFARPINHACQRRYGKTPNRDYMILGLILQFERINHDLGLTYLQTCIQQKK